MGERSPQALKLRGSRRSENTTACVRTAETGFSMFDERRRGEPENPGEPHRKMRSEFFAHFSRRRSFIVSSSRASRAWCVHTRATRLPALVPLELVSRHVHGHSTRDRVADEAHDHLGVPRVPVGDREAAHVTVRDFPGNRALGRAAVRLDLQHAPHRELDLSESLVHGFPFCPEGRVERLTKRASYFRIRH